MSAVNVLEMWISEVLDGDRALWKADCVVAHALERADMGVQWVRDLTINDRVADAARAVACHALRERNDSISCSVAVRILGESADAWARLHAAEALGGPWAAPQVEALIAALGDRQKVYDPWSVFRVSDAAGFALEAIGSAHTELHVARWKAHLRRELHSPDTSMRQLAAYALSRLRDPEGLRILAEMAAADHDDWQAQHLLEDLTARRAGAP